jgi:high affinity sulfate transporter 1
VSTHAPEREPTRFDRLLPGVATLRVYRRGWLRGDVIAGVTVTAYLVPQVMAYAQIAGLPPVVGLWAILITFPLYALLGSSRQLSVGPESTTALLAASVVAPLALGDPSRYAALCATLALVVGAICVLAWALRLGVLADLFSKPVLIGYLAGVAVIMMGSQIDKLTGVPSSGTTFIDEMSTALGNLSQMSLPTLALGLGVLAFLIFVNARWPKLPGPLLAVVLAGAAVAAFGLQQFGIAVIGEIPAGLPALTVPAIDPGTLNLLLLPAVGVAIVAYTDNVLTARSFSRRAGKPIDANQELLALGAANVGAGLIQSFPVSSSASRTVIGEQSGSRTQVHSLVAAACVVVVLVALRPLLASFPKAALGAIVIYAALRLIEWAEFKRLWRYSRAEFAVAISATVGVLLFDILYGVLIAVALSVSLMLWRVARPHAAVLGLVPDLAGMHDVNDFPDAHTVPGLVVFRYDSPLFFANADNFRHRALVALAEQAQLAASRGEPRPRWFLINAEANVDVDATAADALAELHDALAERGVVLALARVKQELRDDLERAGLIDTVGPQIVFPTLPTGVEVFHAWVIEHPDHRSM